MSKHTKTLKWLAAVAGIGGALTFLVVQIRQPLAPPVVAVMAATPTPAATPTASVAPDSRRIIVTGDATDDAAAAEPTASEAGDKLAPSSDAFAARVDQDIPRRLMSGMASCYRGGLDPDARLKFKYVLRIQNGQARATNIEVLKSDLDDRAIEQCMTRALETAVWSEDDLPDFAEESELLLTLRGLKKYKSDEERAEQDELDRVAVGAVP